MTANLPPLKKFILPGGDLAASQLQISRSICRRWEREMCSLLEFHATVEFIVAYANRLSDALFQWARYLNLQAQIEEIEV